MNRVLQFGITALFSALLAVGGVLWTVQHETQLNQQKTIDGLLMRVTELEGADKLSVQDRGQLRRELNIVEGRQQQVFGVLSAMNPKAISVILEFERVH